MVSLKIKRNHFVYTLCIFLFSNSKSLAQAKFYIEPMLRGKIGISSIAPESYFSTEKKLLEPQFLFIPYAVSQSSRIIKRPTVDFGIDLGMISKNNFNKYHVSWNRDQVSYEVETYFREYDKEVNAGFSGLLRRQYHRFSFCYSTKITRNPTFISSWLTIGVGLAFNYNKNIINPEGNLQENLTQDVILKKIYFQTFEEKKINATIQVGLENDIYLFKKYYFSLGLLYSQGLGKLSRIEYVHSYLKNNEPYLYRAGLDSRGSGFYLQLSRRFQIYPWKGRKVKNS